MKPSDQEELVHRMLDGDLSPEEESQLEILLEKDPDLRAEVDSLRCLSESLRSQIPEEIEPPYPDFFNHQIKRAIEAEAAAAAPAPAKHSFSWFALPWGIAAAALAVAAFLGLQQANDRGGRGALVAEGRSGVSTTYTPLEGVTAETFFSDEAQATVIRLEGLEELPANREIAAHQAAPYHGSNAQHAATRLHDTEGNLLLVLLEDAQGGAPTFFYH